MSSLVSWTFAFTQELFTSSVESDLESVDKSCIPPRYARFAEATNPIGSSTQSHDFQQTGNTPESSQAQQ
jgi:hypothetical protein